MFRFIVKSVDHGYDILSACVCICLVNVHNVAEFDENKIQSTDVHRQVCTVISNLSSSHYLRHQQNSEITYSNTEETALDQ